MCRTYVHIHVHIGGHPLQFHPTPFRPPPPSPTHKKNTNSTPDPQRDLVAPALAGVENVLGAVARVVSKGKGMGTSPPPRVVLTSSTGAFAFCVCACMR